jgi:hypothetical protein
VVTHRGQWIGELRNGSSLFQLHLACRIGIRRSRGRDVTAIQRRCRSLTGEQPNHCLRDVIDDLARTR